MERHSAKATKKAVRWPAIVAASVAVAISLLLAILTLAGAGVEARAQVPGASMAPGQTYGPGVPIEQRLFPSDNPWNTDISGYPVDPASARYLARMGLDTGLHADFGTVWNGAPNGIPYVVVPGDQPRVPISFYYADESDPGPYPIPADAPVEGGAQGTGDRHILILDPDNQKLYEVYDAHRVGVGWEAGSGAVFDLTSNVLRQTAGHPQTPPASPCWPASSATTRCRAA